VVTLTMYFRLEEKNTRMKMDRSQVANREH